MIKILFHFFAGFSGSRVQLYSLNRIATHEIRLTRSVPVRPFSESSVYYASKDGVKDGDGGKVDDFDYRPRMLCFILYQASLIQTVLLH